MTLDEFVADVDHPMLVVTTVAGELHAGCLVGFHSQCSIEPLRYAVWLSKANRTFRVAVHADFFGLHFLEAKDRELAELFGARTGDDEDKFAQCDWQRGPEGLRLLECRATVTARRVGMHDDGGDHVCFVLELQQGTPPADFEPLMFSRIQDIDAGHPPNDSPRPTRPV
jgi:flavin reductase (DIM6/NTAB) family NADH-FMN oxidoreductase RutF